MLNWPYPLLSKRFYEEVEVDQDKNSTLKQLVTDFSLGTRRLYEVAGKNSKTRAVARACPFTNGSLWREHLARSPGTALQSLDLVPSTAT